MDCFLRGLPHLYQDLNAPLGTVILFQISGDCGGQWFLSKGSADWDFASRAAPDPAARVTIPQELAWRLFTKGVDREAAREQVEMEGETEISKRTDSPSDRHCRLRRNCGLALTCAINKPYALQNCVGGTLCACVSTRPIHPCDSETRLTNLEAAVKAAQSAGDNAWMLVSAALVLMMTGPGLALFYGGLVRRKNVLSTMMHSFVLMAVVSVLWAIAGYSLAFGEGLPFIGDLRYLFLNNVGAAPNPDYCRQPSRSRPVHDVPAHVRDHHAGPYLRRVCRAHGVKLQRDAPVLHAVAVHRLYPAGPHGNVAGKGGLLNAFSGGRIPCLDFAGGTVVHISSGVSALVCALYLGKRKGYMSDPMKPHSPVGADQRDRRLSAVGGLVRIQRWKRSGRISAGYQRIHCHALRHGCGDSGVVARRMDPQREAQRVGRYLRARLPDWWPYHARVRIREASFPAILIGFLAGIVLLLHGHRGEEQVRL